MLSKYPLQNSHKRSWIRGLLTLYFAFKNQRSPWYARAAALLPFIYLISPVDLVPDVIPVLGYVDDIIIVPALIQIATLILPQDIREQAQYQAKIKQKRLTWIVVLMCLLVIGSMVLLFYLLKK